MTRPRVRLAAAHVIIHAPRAIIGALVLAVVVIGVAAGGAR